MAEQESWKLLLNWLQVGISMIYKKSREKLPTIQTVHTVCPIGSGGQVAFKK
jgi:hypothetical protein